MNIKYTCPECHSEEVLRDAFAEWNSDKQEWVLHDIYDDYCCNTCGLSFAEPKEEEVNEHQEANRSSS